MSDDDSVILRHVHFFYCVLRHFSRELVRPKMNGVKMFALSTAGMFGFAKAYSLTSSTLLKSTLWIGTYGCYLLALGELFGLFLRAMTLHSVYFCCSHDH